MGEGIKDAKVSDHEIELHLASSSSSLQTNNKERVFASMIDQSFSSFFQLYDNPGEQCFRHFAFNVAMGHIYLGNLILLHVEEQHAESQV
jgi:hypothetical protein